MTMNLVSLIKQQYANHCADVLRTPLFIRGKSGVGKSHQIAQAAKELGVNFYDYRMTQRDPVDLKGLPTPDKDKGVTNWLPHSDFYFPADTKGIMLLDEITSVDPSMQSALYEIFLDHKVGGIPLPHDLMVVTAGNRQEDKGTYYPLASPIWNRVIVVDYEPDENDWLDGYAVHNDVHHAVSGFIKTSPEHLHTFDGIEGAFASPRSWTTVSNIVKAYEGLPSLMQQMVVGAVGKKSAYAFLSYYKEVAQMPSAEDVLNGKEAFPSGIKAYSMAFKIAAWCRDQDQMRVALKYLLNAFNGKSNIPEEAKIALFVGLFNRATERTADGRRTFIQTYKINELQEFTGCLMHKEVQAVIHGTNIKELEALTKELSVA